MAEVQKRFAAVRLPDLTRQWRGLTVWAIGHSTHPLPEFLGLLEAHGIAVLADVRTIPRSRAQPQFNRETLPRALARAGIRYVHLEELGGRRYGFGRSSPNGAWRNASFRGYADHMLGEEFERGLDRLRALVVETGPTALMCAEGMRWRCHRSMIADALVARGAQVLHIESRVRAVPHTLTPFAVVWRGRVGYPEQT